MKEIKFSVPRDCNLSRAPRVIESVCAQRGLELVMKGTAASYPGSIHWHYKQSKQKGTLELTLYPPARRLRAKIQEGRKAPWIDEELPRLRRAIESALRDLAP